MSRTKGHIYFFLRDHTSSWVQGIHGFLSIYAHIAAAKGVRVGVSSTSAHEAAAFVVVCMIDSDIWTDIT
jgi:hypothetical protein